MDEAGAVTQNELAADTQAKVELEARIGAVGRQVEKVKKKLDVTEAKAEKTPKTWGEYDELMDEVEELRMRLYFAVATALDHRYSTKEVAGWFGRAGEMGCTRPSVTKELLRDLMNIKKVPNAQFREAILALPDPENTGPGPKYDLDIITKQHIADRVTNGDCTYLRRLVGLAPIPNTKGAPTLRLWISYEQGVALAQALGIPLVEAGV